MPAYSEIEEIDQSKPLDMSNVKYSAGTIFKAAAADIQGGFVAKSIVKNSTNVKPDSSVPMSYPADQAFIDDIKKTRPGFNAPVGLPKFVVGALADQYDNDEYFKKVSARPASVMGKVGALGGEFLGSFADPKQLIYGFSGAKVAESFVTPIAEGLIAKLAVKDIIGAGSARVGSEISAHAIGGAGFNEGAAVSGVTDDWQVEDITGEPHNYISKLQQLGSAPLYGAIAGVGFYGAGKGFKFGTDSLLGRKVEIAPEKTHTFEPEDQFTVHNRYETEQQAQEAADVHAAESPLKHDYQTEEGVGGDFILSKRSQGGTVVRPAVYERQGGLLNRQQFSGMAQQTKDLLAKIFKPWTKAADDVTKTEAMGQMANGSLVDVEPVIKQGMYDEGVAFREAVAQDPMINVEDIDSQLAEAQQDITSEMFQHYYEYVYKGTSEADLQDIYKRFKSDPTFFENMPDTIPQDVRDTLLKYKDEFIKLNESQQKPFENMNVNSDFVGHEFYHGTGQLESIENFDISRADESSLYGYGLYITDNKKIALGYAKARKPVKGSEGKILELKFNEQPKLIDIEKVPPKDVFDVIAESAKDIVDDSDRNSSLSEIYQDIRDRIEHDEYNPEVLTEINNKLNDLGYDGFLHEGGIQGGEKHNVVVLFSQEYSQRLPDGTVNFVSKNPADKLSQKSIDMVNQYKEKLKLFDKMTGDLDKKIQEIESKLRDSEWHLKARINEQKRGSDRYNHLKSLLNQEQIEAKKQISALESQKLKLEPQRDSSVLDDLSSQYHAAQMMRDNIGNKHEALSQGEMEAYAKHLQESNMPDTGYSIDAGTDYTVDEQLSKFSDADIKTLAEQTNKSKVGGKEIERSAEKLKNQKVYDEMAQSMTDCILKGGL